MRRSRFIPLVIASVVATPLFVHAQSTSGWILWEKNMRSQGGAETVSWEPQDGFDALTECRNTAQQLLQFALAYMKNGGGKLLGEVRPDGRSAVFDVSEAGVQQTIDIRYVCFPGTFDPRPQRP